MWQKCWNTNQNLIHHLRFRERGPLKSWRPETMAEAIFSVLKEGLSLSQAARKFDIPYPTFVLYANRVHNMLGPSIDGGTDLRPKGRGRPQRILLGIWPDEHIKSVIKSVVFRDAKDFKDDPAMQLAYGRHSPVFPFPDGSVNYGVPPNNGLSAQSPIGNSDSMSPDAATAAAITAMAHGLRQQMQMAGVHPDLTNFNLPSHCSNLTIHPASDSGGGEADNQKSLDIESPSQILSNGSISLTRLDSPTSLQIHGLPNLLGHAASHHRSTSDLNSISPEHSPNSIAKNQNKSTSQIKPATPPNTTSSQSSVRLKHTPSLDPNSISLTQIPTDDEHSIDSELEITVEPSVNLAVGVSGLSYKSSRNFSSSPRSETLFQDDINNLGNSSGTLNDSPSLNERSSSRLSNFKDSPSSIKIEPIISECRGE